jgi:hypothetical protein
MEGLNPLFTYPKFLGGRPNMNLQKQPIGDPKLLSEFLTLHIPTIRAAHLNTICIAEDGKTPVCKDPKCNCKFKEKQEVANDEEMGNACLSDWEAFMKDFMPWQSGMRALSPNECMEFQKALYTSLITPLKPNFIREG